MKDAPKHQVPSWLADEFVASQKQGTLVAYAEGSFPQAEAHAREAITLPLYPAMTEQQQDEVIGAVLEFLG